MPLSTLCAVKHSHKMLAAIKVSLILVIKVLRLQLAIQAGYANDIWMMFSLIGNESNGIMEDWFCKDCSLPLIM